MPAETPAVSVTGEKPAGSADAGGARTQLRQQIRERKRLRVATLVLTSLLLLGALPMFFGIRAATRDPVFNTLDALGVPAWASANVEDEISGSRWCIIDCRLRERRVESAQGPDATAQAYANSLEASGWRPWNVALCPDQPVPEGQHYTCWRRDEYTLDLWVRQPPCADDPLLNRPTVDPDGNPREGQAQGQLPQQARKCDGAVVSIKVRNAIDDDRGRPLPPQDPGLTGEDPDPVFTDSPLLDEETPSTP